MTFPKLKVFLRALVFLGRLFLLSLAALAILNLFGCTKSSTGLLNPKGIIAFAERKLFFDTLALMLIVVLPVIIMSFTFVYHYKASNLNRDYQPNLSHSYFLETLWWGIPCAIIIVLAFITWKKTYELDPYIKVAGNNQTPMIIQVIALPWKWLFIYPQEGIATINYLAIPVDHPVEYWMTADNVPMSAFFIPQLGSQIYVMAGMRTRLNLIANDLGIFNGLNTQFNGDGFSEMHFQVHVIEPQKMQQWITEVKASSQPLTEPTYTHLLNPSINDQPKFFAGVPNNLFDNVIMLYRNTVGTVHPRDSQFKSAMFNHEV